MNDVDVLIVGAGIMGAATAARLREADPELRIAMVDAGPRIGTTPGEHLHESTDEQTWSRYNQRVSSGIQGLYVGDGSTPAIVDSIDELEPGMHRLISLGEQDEQLPGAALGWNLGGMGVHWTAATPWPEEQERFGDPERWPADLAIAQRLLKVSPSPIGPTTVGTIVLDTLGRHLAEVSAADRAPQPMPMAVTPAEGRKVRTGPSAIFPAIALNNDPHFVLVIGSIVTALLREGDRVAGALLRDAATGETSTLTAEVVIVCADALRTPQLLFASGIRPPALGAYLNEHAFLSNRVLLDLERFGLSVDDLPAADPGEFVTDSLWIPSNAPAQPFQAQVMNITYVDDAAAPIAHSVGLSIYVPLESRAANRVRFSESETDLVGMPRMTVEFGYSDSDVALIERARSFVQEVAGEFGAWDPDTESVLLPAGSSLHFTGTVRSGAEDDGTSVCDPGGRVWGIENLFVAGNGVIPTALACNSTLTGVVTAIRASEAALLLLSDLKTAAALTSPGGTR